MADITDGRLLEDDELRGEGDSYRWLLVRHVDRLCDSFMKNTEKDGKPSLLALFAGTSVLKTLVQGRAKKDFVGRSDVIEDVLKEMLQETFDKKFPLEDSRSRIAFMIKLLEWFNLQSEQFARNGLRTTLSGEFDVETQEIRLI